MRLEGGACLTLDGATLPISPAAERKLRSVLGGRWIVLHRCDLRRLDDAFLRLQRDGGNGYSALESVGAVLIAPSRDATLTGGSYATSTMVQLSGRVAVRKAISRSIMAERVDAQSRLAREIEWLQALPLDARQLFPRVIGVEESPGSIGYLSEFVPGYTLSERLFHGSISVKEAGEVILTALRGLRRHLYGRRLEDTAHTATEWSYVERIRRRARAIERSPASAGSDLRRLLRAREVEVNGVRCPGMDELLDGISRSEVLKVFEPQTPEYAHGDLILDDIVIGPGGKPRLLDPNGHTHTRLYDVGKLCLSLLTLYEFFKYDYFNCRVSSEAGTLTVRVRPREHRALERYAQLAAQLPEILRASNVLEVNSPRLTGVGLLLLNGLQNLALPMFHLLHHGAEQRAVAFQAIGMLRLTQADAMLANGRKPSLNEICEQPVFD